MNDAALAATRQHLLAHPVVAILRGIRPQECVGVADTLVEAGIRTLEVPLNSPDPLASIGMLARHLDGEALVGAGTVLDAAQVDAVADAGARIALAPNRNVEVIRRAVSRGLYAMPGVATVSEAFEALAAGAHGLKLFPADVLAPASFKAWRAVLPVGVELFAVGGVDADNLAAFRRAGACGAGLGGSLYTPGIARDELARRARAALAAWAAAGAGR
ncbi:2-dehydro-3-deoxy-6-phosphogalactonate aldolase [Variovorax sp. OV329]|uniref:2-dehydro-3-deoxy-6-phosphogalactonate aldolase n=1 Tax=Variovorax sp. OV329 TaxID=1882825 RepID=UPI0008F34370|nr:2-dehydro-3-deoxy-6-phosphogalactonate aldolase [Variovorax sp. OV329]SFM93580.1 2-keto-3-deoxy-phosphogalactonate aldolase [Variovorax sp. OV329]